jgi:nucleotidyltransferase/DNA polymerase involved in DNA repair
MFACVHIPDFPVAVFVRAEPLLRERAVAVLDGKPPQVRVFAVNDKARLLGMDIGMTKLQAAIFAASSEKAAISPSEPKKKSSSIELSRQSVKPHPKPIAAVLRQRSPAQEKSSQAALLDVAHAFTPRVEDTHPGRLLLDLAGLERLYGPATAMARELASRVSAVGLECNIGMAANPDAAMHAAGGFSGITVIPVGEEAKRLGVLPIHVLLDSFDIACGEVKTATAAREREKLQEQMLDTLERWGVRDFRTLALLPEHALAARLGEAGAHLQRLSRGACMRTVALSAPQVHFEEALELESPVETLEPLSFLLNRLLEQLCVRLEARALAVQELKLRLQLEPRVGDEQTITLEELTATQSQGTTNSRSVILSGGVAASATPKSKDLYPALKASSSGFPSVVFQPTEVEGCSPAPQSRSPLAAGSLTPQSLAAERPTPSIRPSHDSNLYTRTLRLPVSMRDPKVFLKLLQLDLSAHPPGAPVCKLWISAEPTRPRSAQHGLFLPVTPEAERLEITLARISGVVGERRAGIAKLLDTHRPGAFQVEHFVAQEEPAANENGGPTLPDNSGVPPVALRIFRPSRQIRVQMEEGRPCKLAMLTPNVERNELEGKILWSAGPWRSSGDWWTDHSVSKSNSEEIQIWDREEWDVALSNDGNGVALYRIYRDTGTGHWFADASYD